MFQFVRPKWMHLPAGAIEHEPDRLCDYNIKFGTDSYLPVWRRSGKSCVPQVTNCWPPAKKKQTKKKGTLYYIRNNVMYGDCKSCMLS